RLSLTVARWRILRFPLSESTLNFRIFLFNRPAVCVKCFTSAVSMEAHYRDPIFLHKRFLDLFFCLLIFHPFRSIPAQSGDFLMLSPLAQRR
ncbi:hypothetical protein MU807_24010, partial [Salmonella enterica subsp. enterica serovar Enteritidis]|nr:hypothetical protein [Salmonella enterica subsp. enterica serovar Enteritidis]MDL2892446.1 hypothetical protein [Salmonella enterica]MCL8989568.1 hypothetical protein [Salmonella enterica subsp. enterica serovar Enteritidis]MCL9167295.1 hypothetical protein [Salmonella enterica subsp. enterica serovar Enteritidis]MCL9394746.1 hypothetical protein [Salmonella enterica subsp. enterica serovar Enteritidis]